MSWAYGTARIDWSPIVTVSLSLQKPEILVDGTHTDSRRVTLTFSSEETTDPTTFRKLFVLQSSGFPSPNPLDLTNLVFVDGTRGSLSTFKGMVVAMRWPDSVREARCHFTGNTSQGYDGAWDLGTTRYYLTPQSPVVVLAGWIGYGISSTKKNIKFEPNSGGVPSTLVVIWGD